MPKGRYFVFEPFRLDVLDERLWECDRSVRLGHKALAVLQRLVSQSGQLVTKDDLLATAWPDTAVSDEVLTTAMRELRRALGDPARTPRFVETVHGRGYRFIAPVAETDIPVLKAKSTTQSNEADALVPWPFPRVASSGWLVGREAEWVRLEEWYATVQQGRRQIGFVAGEAGIGKTALVEAFVSELAARRKARVGRGQCVEHYGAGEAYLPILEALGRLGRDPAVPVADLLRHHAPSWLVHLPSLASGKEFKASAPATPEKMLRELADALEVFTARDPLILVLEDLHWSDTATLEVLAYVARRPDPARLMILGTYRPIEALRHRHPLRDVIAELRPHSQCAELVLDNLSGEAVGAYLLQRCGPVPRLKELAEVLGRRTGGLPLFVTTVVDELMRRRVLEGTDAAGFAPTDLQAIENVIPTGVRQFIEHRFEQLAGEDQAILEAAGVAGDPFSIAAVAAATICLPEERVEARCAAWARQGQFVSADGTVTWPDGTLASRYRFRHALFQEVVYARTSPERRARLHQRIGGRLEGAYGKGAAAIAAELAMHFEQGRDSRRAVSYLGQAARNALQRSAYSEARGHLTRGLGVLEGVRQGRKRLRQELELSLLLGQLLMTTKGWGDEEVGRVYARSRELCEQLGDAPRLLQATYGLIVVSIVRAELRKAQALSRDLLALAKKRRDPIYQVLAHTELGGTGFALGEPASVGRHFTQAERLYHPRQHRSHVAAFGMDMGLFSRMWETHFLWHQGHPDRARARAQKTLGLARKLSHPFALAITLAYAAMLSQFHRDVDQVERLAEATIALCAEHGFPYYRAWAEVLQGWSRSARGAGVEGVAKIRPAIGVLQPMAGLRLPYYLALLAEACGWTARADEAHQALADAFADVQKTEQRWWEAELHRLRGELLRSEGMNRRAEAQACFLTAIEIARGQQAKSLELRAAVSLGRLWRDEGKRSQARRLVAEVYDWFTEGFDTPDLREARSLLEEQAP